MPGLFGDRLGCVALWRRFSANRQTKPETQEASTAAQRNRSAAAAGQGDAFCQLSRTFGKPGAVPSAAEPLSAGASVRWRASSVPFGHRTEFPLVATPTFNEPGDCEGDSKPGNHPDNESQKESPWSRCRFKPHNAGTALNLRAR